MTLQEEIRSLKFEMGKTEKVIDGHIQQKEKMQ